MLIRHPSEGTKLDDRSETLRELVEQPAFGAHTVEQRELLIAELNHRIRNIFSLVRGIVSQSRQSATTVDGLASVLGERIDALSRAHDQLTGDRSGPASFHELVAAEAGAYLQGKASRVAVSGPRATLSLRAFTTVALVMHEMITNSAKYGALSNSRGQVLVETEFDADGSLIIDWRESGGPRVQRPTRRGFGSTVIERSIPHDLGGETTLEFVPEGLHARFKIPSPFVTRHENSRGSPHRGGRAR